MCHYVENVNKKEERRIDYFRILNKGIQFTNYVGVIQAGNLTIEVLPKVDKEYTTAANIKAEELQRDISIEKQQWHDVLLQMLKECRFLKVNHVDYANLNLHSNSILDIYIELFLAETEKLLHEGLLKKYRKKEGNKTTLKGQLLFQKQIAYNSTHQERFYIRYTEYNRNNIYNQILYKTLCLIPKISTSSYLHDKVGRLQLNFPELSGCNINVETFNRLTFDRKTERYKEAILISKMLLLNYRPDITGGSENVIAILFDMNKLWEEFVFRRLKKVERDFGVEVLKQQSEDFWLSPQYLRTKTIRPDVVIKKGTETIVLDTKWKIIDDMIPADEDLKQMFTYNLYWDCSKSILLYPSNISENSIGEYLNFKKGTVSGGKCAVIKKSLLDNELKLDALFGIEILNYIKLI